MKKRLFFLFIALTFHFTILHGQQIITAERYLEMVSDHYASIRDYEANIVIRSGNTDMIGNLSFLSPSFLRIDFTRPAEQVIAFNGEVLTVFVPDMRALLTQTINQRRASTGGSSQGLSMLRRNYVSSFVTGPNPEPLEGSPNENVVRLRLTRRSVAEGFREIILSINPDTMLIRRMEGRTIADGEVRFDFTNVRTNVGIPEQRFIYEPPPLASVYNNFLFRDVD